MFSVKLLPDGGFTLQAGGRALITGGRMILRDHKGAEEAVSFSQLSEEEGRFLLRAATEDYRASLAFQPKGEALAVSAEAEWFTHGAKFQGMRAFPAKEGVRLELPGAEGFFTGPCMAVYQHKAWWIRPAFFTGAAAAPARTQLLLSRQGEEYQCLTAVAGEECRCDFSGGEKGLRASLSLGAEGHVRCRDLMFTLALGPDPYAACRETVAFALTLLQREHCLRENKTLPEMFQYLGWCSWDAFYQKVNQAGLVEKMEELRQKQVPVRWALIDDGWSDADYSEGVRLLRGFDAAPEKFPEGIGGAVKKLKEEFGLFWVGVWQAVMGYWNGLEPGSAAHQEARAWLAEMPDGRLVPDAEPGKAFAFWDHWHSYLERQGVDFAKVDEQSAVSIFHGGRRTYGQACRAAHAGLEGSGAVHFANRVIHCMGTAPEDMWNRTGAAAVSRSSDDFVPHTEHGFREHAIQNSYNSLLHGQFYWGDWDMFWSDHSEARQNSILRAVSGGSVYTSDAPGKTDPAEILPLVLPDGRVLRCRGTGVPTLDCLFEDPVHTRVPLKIWNSGEGFTAVAAFHICQEEAPCQGSLGGEDIPALKGKDLWCWDWESRRACRLKAGERMPFTLQPGEARLYLLLPAGAPVAPLGLADKYLAPAAILRREERDGSLTAVLAARGRFAFLAEQEPAAVLADGRPASWKREGCLFQLEQEAEQIQIQY